MKVFLLFGFVSMYGFCYSYVTNHNVSCFCCVWGVCTWVNTSPPLLTQNHHVPAKQGCYVRNKIALYWRINAISPGGSVVHTVVP